MSLARPWKSASWVKRSVFSTLPSKRTSLDDSIAITCITVRVRVRVRVRADPDEGGPNANANPKP